MKVEATRFRVKSGKSQQVDRWLEMLKGRMPEVLQTLDREKMYAEVIFREKIKGEDFLYWFSFQGEGGELVSTSPYDVDKKHIEFWNECIDREFGKEELNPEVVMIPGRILALMK